MKTERREPIPIPMRKRWHLLRVRWLPPLVLIAGFGAVAFLWREHVASLTIVGQAEPVVSDVSCYKPGVLAELNVARFQRVKAGDTLPTVSPALTRFQRVKAGDTVGKVLITEPRI